jgi:type I restriction enzyme S subunit
MNTKQLRQKILDLAIRGKLVPQDPADEPASVLLERITAEKAQLVRDGKIKADKKGNSSPATSDKSHYGELPSGWANMKLGDIIVAIDPQPSHRTPPISNDGVPYVGISECDYETKAVDFKSARKVSNDVLMEHLERYTIKNGDFIIGKIGTIGKPFFIPLPQNYALSANVVLIQPIEKRVDSKFVFYLLSSEFIENQFSNNSRATTQAAFGILKVRDIDIVLPPITEQRRIVAAIESAFAVIDEIEQNKTDLQSAVTSAKSKILSLAVSAKLVPQDPADEPASVLLDRIKTERAKLIKAGKIKPDKREKEAAVTRDNSHYADMPFDVPKSWAWCAFGEVCDYGNCVNETPDNIPNNAWILDLEDIEKDTGRIAAFVSKSEREFYSSKHIFHAGQVLYSNLRPYLNKVLVAPKDGYCTSEIIPLKFETEVDSGYFRYLLMSPYFLAYANLCSYGVKMPRLGAANAKKALIPLPPLAEQSRIVVAIETAFAQLDGITQNASN